MYKNNTVTNALKENNKALFDSLEPSAKELQERQEKLDRAQISTAAELQKLREDLERIERKQDESQKEQAKDTKKAYNVSLIAIGLNALAIVVAVLIAFLS